MNVTLTASSPLPPAPPPWVLSISLGRRTKAKQRQRHTGLSVTKQPPTAQPRAPTLQPGPGISPLSKQGTVVQGQRGSWKCKDEDGHKRGKWKRGRNKRQG